MKHLFDPENSFWQFMTNVSNALAVGILWVVCCLPIITIGVSTAALFTYTLKLTDNTEGYVFQTFFKNFKNHFYKSTTLWILILLGCGILTVNAYVLLSIGTLVSNIMFFLTLTIAFMFVILFIYIFPVLVWEGNKTGIKKLIKDSFILGIGHLPVTLAILVIYVISGFIIYENPYLLFLLCGFVAYLSSFFYVHVFKKYDHGL